MNNSKARCSAFDKAINLLTFKDRTTKEIIQKLEEKGYSSEEIEETVVKLSYYGYLNDQNYTVSFIKDNTSKKGKKLIISELAQKGIDKSLVNEIYDNTDVDEVSVIEDIVSRRYNTVDFNDDKTYKRIVGYFLRRGFSYDSIKRVLNKFRTWEEFDY